MFSGHVTSYIDAIRPQTAGGFPEVRFASARLLPKGCAHADDVTMSLKDCSDIEASGQTHELICEVMQSTRSHFDSSSTVWWDVTHILEGVRDQHDVGVRIELLPMGHFDGCCAEIARHTCHRAPTAASIVDAPTATLEWRQHQFILNCPAEIVVAPPLRLVGCRKNVHLASLSLARILRGI